MFRICIDFDGVLNTYEGNFDENNLYEPRKGIKEFLKKLSEMSDEICILSTREPKIVRKWLESNKLSKYIKLVTDIKLPAKIYIDDRGYKFNGNFEDTLEDIKQFNTYWEEK